MADAASDYLQIVVFFPSGQISELQRPRPLSVGNQRQEKVLTLAASHCRKDDSN